MAKRKKRTVNESVLEGRTVRMPAEWWEQVDSLGEQLDRKPTSMARHLIRLALDAALWKRRPVLDVPEPGEGRR